VKRVAMVQRSLIRTDTNQAGVHNLVCPLVYYRLNSSRFLREA
jgi:hypothetical protein